MQKAKQQGVDKNLRLLGKEDVLRQKRDVQLEMYLLREKKRENVGRHLVLDIAGLRSIVL